MDLDSFISGQESEGDFDSKGSFTYAAKRASLKLSKFNLPGGYDWVLKLVQAATIWGADRLIVSQSRVATSFFFVPEKGTKFPTEATILSALLGEAMNQDSALANLGAALCSLVEQRKLSFVLAVMQDGKKSPPVFSGDHISKLPKEVRESWTELSKDGIRLTISHFQEDEAKFAVYFPTLSLDKRKVPRRDLKIAKILLERCFASPMSIYLDNRRITDLVGEKEVGGNFLFRPLQIGALTDAGETDRVEEFSAFSSHRIFSVPEHFFSGARVYYLCRTIEWLELDHFLRSNLKDVKSESRLSVRSHVIYWLRHGVLVGKSHLTNNSVGTSISVFVDASELRSDLSGLSINLNQGMSETFTHGREVIAGALEYLSTGVPQLLEDSLVGNTLVPAEEQEPEDDLQATLSAFGQSVDRPLRSLLSKVPSVRDLARRYSPSSVKKVKFFTRWSFMLPDELKTVAKDLREEELRHSTSPVFP